MDTEVHEKERLVSQLQMRVAVLEQESKDKDQLMRRTKEVLEATQQQKVKMNIQRTECKCDDAVSKEICPSFIYVADSHCPACKRGFKHLAEGSGTIKILNLFYDYYYSYICHIKMYFLSLGISGRKC